MLFQKLWLIKWGFGEEWEEQNNLFNNHPLCQTKDSQSSLPLSEREKELSEE